jgi:beta-glucosidase
MTTYLTVLMIFAARNIFFKRIVSNIGNFDGDEIVKLYTFDREANVARPIKKLTGFQSVALKQGESKQVIFKVGMRQFAFLDLDMNLVVESGNTDIMVGASSNDIRLTGSIKIQGIKLK